ncbi:hypothetical protein M4R22_03390 [Acidovorax sp. GBBC 3334]|uniref:hypothetical protein n=1 Tax=Acidovorax sp. GBBC 3334 TaxID=2940496 RepID=UPI0023044FC7|nr:hypothetical protein [Acidovorax sp. GBBC 3334]MDA8453801.1 hypothetical protein [Acidovorax sp. GBBC 3334]
MASAPFPPASAASSAPAPSGESPAGGQPGRDPLSFGASVAGEEDPGASFDNDGTGAPRPAASAPPAGPRSGIEPREASPPLAPGDEAAPGTPGTGEDLCPACGGSGRREGAPCAECAGTGRVTVGIGGA